MLQDAGFPIYDEPMADGRRSIWRVEDSFRRRLPLKLTLVELVALRMSRELGPAGMGVLAPALASFSEKIGAVLSQDALALIDRMRDTIGVRAAGAKLQAPAAEHLSAIHQALLDRRRVRMRYIRERLWHPTQRFRELDGGRLEMTVRVADTLEVRRWILGFGSEAELLEPAALREALRADAEALSRKLVPRRIVGSAAPSTPAGARPRTARTSGTTR